MLCYAVYCSLGVSPRRQRNDAGVAHAQVRSPVYSQLRVDHAADLAREHRAGPSEVVRSNGAVFDISSSILESRDPPLHR